MKKEIALNLGLVFASESSQIGNSRIIGRSEEVSLCWLSLTTKIS